MIALGRAVERRGHRITFFQIAAAESVVRAGGLGFCTIPCSPAEFQRRQEFLDELSRLRGIATVRLCTKWFQWEAELFFREAPDRIAVAGIDGLIVDQVTFHGVVIAKKLGIPYLIASNALPLNTESGVPPSHLGWQYSDTPAARKQNEMAHAAFSLMTLPLQEAVLGQARAWNLNLAEDEGRIPHIAQLPECLDFPRTELPRHFHYTGPFVEPALLSSVPFAWERLDGRPLIYASLGTLVNGSGLLFRTLLEACDGLPAQVVITLGGGRVAPESLGETPSNVIAVPYVPQWAILDRATMAITHAGLNTALHTLMHGLPMVAIPIASEEPGIAARLAWRGVAEILPVDRLSAPRLQSAILRVLNEPAYRDSALELQARIEAAKGLETAAALVEHYLCDTTRTAVSAV